MLAEVDRAREARADQARRATAAQVAVETEAPVAIPREIRDDNDLLRFQTGVRQYQRNLYAETLDRVGRAEDAARARRGEIPERDYAPFLMARANEQRMRVDRDARLLGAAFGLDYNPAHPTPDQVEALRVSKRYNNMPTAAGEIGFESLAEAVGAEAGGEDLRDYYRQMHAISAESRALGEHYRAIRDFTVRAGGAVDSAIRDLLADDVTIPTFGLRERAPIGGRRPVAAAFVDQGAAERAARYVAAEALGAQAGPDDVAWQQADAGDFYDDTLPSASAYMRQDYGAAIPLDSVSQQSVADVSTKTVNLSGGAEPVVDSDDSSAATFGVQKVLVPARGRRPAHFRYQLPLVRMGINRDFGKPEVMRLPPREPAVAQAAFAPGYGPGIAPEIAPVAVAAPAPRPADGSFFHDPSADAGFVPRAQFVPDRPAAPVMMGGHDVDALLQGGDAYSVGDGDAAAQIAQQLAQESNAGSVFTS